MEIGSELLYRTVTCCSGCRKTDTFQGTLNYLSSEHRKKIQLCYKKLIISIQNLVLSSMEHAMEGLKDTCGDDLDAVWLLHILRRIRQMYASLIHLDLPNEALDIFGKFILNLRYKILLLFC